MERVGEKGKVKGEGADRGNGGWKMENGRIESPGGGGCGWCGVAGLKGRVWFAAGMANFWSCFGGRTAKKSPPFLRKTSSFLQGKSGL